MTELPSNLWPTPMLVFRITDPVTTSGSTVRAVVVAVTRNAKGEFEIWPDWRLIVRLNELLDRRTFPRHLSQHVGGMVITRGRLDELTPLENAAMPPSSRRASRRVKRINSAARWGRGGGGA